MLPSLLGLVLAAAPLALAAPTLNYPLQDQLPPVARVGNAYTYSLLPSTFTSSSNITYTTTALPAWLSWSPGIETFYGTPSSSDIGQTDITVTATDGTGSTTSKWTAIVSNYSVPAVHSSFPTQIADPSLRAFASASALPGGTGVSVPPFWSFSLGFASDTFRVSHTDPINGELFFAARQRGTSSLPSWLRFDNETMTFNGVAPANGSYTIVATGTDYWGYSGAQTSFVIEVGQGAGIELQKGSNWTDLQTMSRGKVAYTLDLSDVLVNGQAAGAGQLAVSMNSADFSWLSLDSSSHTFSGTTPDRYINGTVSPLSIPITIASTNTSDTLTLTSYVAMDILPYFFTTFNLPNASVTPGSFFSWSLGNYVVNKTAIINATVSPSDASSWLSFNPSNMTLTGMAPKNPSYATVDVIFHASQGGNTATTDLKVAMTGVTATTSSTGTAAVSTSSSGSSSSGGLSKGAKIGIGIACGLIAMILLLLLLFCCCRRRKQRQAENDTRDNDADSFVVGSPTQANDPFRKSNTLDPPRNIFGEIAKFSPFGNRQPEPNSFRPTSGATSGATSETMAERPHRIDGLKGILEWSEKPSEFNTPRLDNGSSSFLGHGDVIGVNDPINRPSQEASSFTQTFGSDTESSRASWESRRSFHWSSAENEGEEKNNRMSTTPSIPRPRQDFTPRYPRNNSPTALARLTSIRDVEGDASPEFSEFGSGEGHMSPGSHEESSNFVSGGSSGSVFAGGPSGLSRFGESQGFKTDDEEADTTDHEGPAVVTMAERQSFETRRPSMNRPTPKLRPSKERVLSPVSNETKRSSQALTGRQSGAFDDAEDPRNSVYAPSTSYEPSEVQGLGYPASAIYFSSPNPDDGQFSNRGSTIISDGRASTIQALRTDDHQHPLSPPLPQVGSFVRPRPISTFRPTSQPAEGRVHAVANETFSIHPPINPPPTVSLSAATWSSNPPSTYRAVAEGGMPAWLHFDARELELWGVPGLANSGDVTAIRIIETLPRDKRRSDPTQFGYEPPQEREVGKVTIEVVDRMRSPQFALDGSPHAL
ncbi:hypothetical protein EHS25_007674 [Saitozyma podzolica]|uniref:Dystroglycan-type cadherin-like domain-containing protein n=1 Tax=Saitozyma podzolica TaxID=1890683 RepID=A0A427YQI2_9TREE|nr:hypothetical protein EHS25_007674 [Saitozyma podzolica]